MADRLFISEGKPAPALGHGIMRGAGLIRSSGPALARAGHMKRILGGTEYRTVDNGDAARAALRRYDLYASCERAPLGWEKKL